MRGILKVSKFLPEGSVQVLDKLDIPLGPRPDASIGVRKLKVQAGLRYELIDPVSGHTLAAQHPKRHGKALVVDMAEGPVLDLEGFFEPVADGQQAPHYMAQADQAAQGPSVIVGGEQPWSALDLAQGYTPHPRPEPATDNVALAGLTPAFPFSMASLGGLMAAGGAVAAVGGGGAGAASSKVLETAPAGKITLSGGIYAGPVDSNPGGDLVVRVYSAKGVLIAQTMVAQDGSYSLTFDRPPGEALLIRSMDSEPGDDEVATHRDEASLELKPLPAMMAAVPLDGVGPSVRVNLSVLTTWAAMNLGLNPEAPPADQPLSAQQIKKANAWVSELLIAGEDLLSSQPVTTVNKDGETNARPNGYGKALHQLSWLEKSHAMGTHELLKDLGQKIDSNSGQLSAQAMQAFAQAKDQTNQFVQKAPANQAPVFTSAQAVVAAENSADAFYTAAALDTDADAILRYGLAGRDAAVFNINPATGAMSFKKAPDFEAPRSSSADPDYRVTLSVSDGLSKPVQQALRITLGDVNDHGPVFTSGSTGTVAENAPIGTAIYTAATTDADGTAAHRGVVYSLKAATGDASLLSIDSATGTVTLKNSADFENKASYSFTVLATNGSMVTERAVSVAVTDVNDNAPAFNSGATGAVVENVALSTAIYTAATTDADGTPAHRGVVYSLKAATGDANLLNIDSANGAVTLKSSADFENKASYSFTVLATNGSMVTERAVTVAVTDVNDNAPAFTSGTTGTVAENAALSTDIYTAATTDADGTPAHRGVVYSLKAATGDANLLSIDSANGAVTLKSSADFENKASYSFTVLATNGSMVTERAVTVAVTDVNDNAPAFTSGTTGTVAENAALSTAIYTAATTDADGTADHRAVSYSLKAATGDANLLNIDSATGTVTLKNSADFENKASYSFTVLATNGSMVTERAVTVAVTDVNDNAPAFTSGTTGTVAENAALSTAIYTAATTDADGTPAHRGVVYSLKAATGDVALMNIDSANGAVTLKNSADFENKASYSFTVLATNGSMVTERAVTVAVTDLNDNSPVFTSGTTGTVAESAGLSTPIYTAVTTDADGTAAHRGVVYSLKAATGDVALLNIDSANGAVTLKNSADFEKKASYSFTVLVTNGSMVTERAVTVAVTDVNDNAPAFTSGTTGTVAENAALSTAIYTAATTDADGTAAHRGVVYSLKADADANLLNIDSATGTVTLKNSADFENKASYSFTVLATNGSMFTERAVTVSVTDVNDNAPAFTSGATGTVAENAALSTAIYTAATTDADGTAAHRGVVYSLKAATGDVALLNIDSANGAVTLKNSADFENKVGYSFTVLATNGSMVTERAVTVSVTDVNDNAPVFTSGTTGTVAENAALSTAIYTAATTDADGTAAHRGVVYSLKAATGDANLLNIDSATGAVTLKNSADFENKASYSFTVLATNGSMVTERAVTVAVTDVNDNAPAFTSGATGTVAENVALSTAIYTAATTDADGTPAHRGVAYSLKAATGDANLLNIDSATGTVTLKNSPDFENKASYSFTVLATNGSEVSENAVTVSVTDVNDNAPAFTSGATGSVAENADLGTAIYTAVTTDADGTAAQRAVSYSLKAATGDASLLNIDSANGAVTLKNSADFENKVGYSFTVLATNGSEVSEKAVTVSVTDVNDNAPVFTSGTTGTVAENAALGTAIYTAVTTDADGTAAQRAVSYSLKAATGDASLLNIDSATGAVTLKNSADFETKASYSFTVLATNGSEVTERAVTVAVTDVNDNAPAFTSGTTGTVAENAALSTAIYTAVTTDADGTPTNRAVAYSLQASGDASLLNIDSATGAVTLKASADFENKASYSFTVLATNGSMVTERAVTVSVTDLNDNAPVFTSGTTGAVAENAALSTVIYTAVTTDADGTPTNRAVAYSLQASGDASLLNIDSATGAVTLKASADFENKVSYSFTVLSTNGSMVTERAVTVAVTDLNDNAPVFTSGTTGTVAENAALSTAIYTAVTTDEDGTPTNRGVAYSLQASGDASLLNIDSATGAVTLKNSANFENKASYSFTVLAINASQVTEQAVTIQVSDTTAPTVSSVVISATNASGTLLNAGDVVTVTATYSETVSGQPTTAPTLTIGAETGIALTAGTTTGNTRTWTYTISSAGTTDTGSISVVGNLVAGITDAAGNAATGSTPTATGSFTADTTAPTVTITDNAAGTATGPVTFTYTFAEAVTGFDTSKVTATGGTKGTFTAVSTTVYTLVVTPTASSTTPIVLSTSTTGVTDAAGNVATAPADYSQTVDTVAPTVSTVVISAAGASAGLLNAGDVVTVTATYSEAVSGQPTTAPTLTIGAETGIALTAGTTTGNTRTWTYTIANTGTTDTGSISVAGNLVAGVSDLAGNAATGSTPTATGSFTADTTAPTVVITDNAAGTATGPVTFTYTFAEAVTGFDTSKVTASGGTKGTFTAVSSTVYTLVVTPTANSTASIVLATSTTGVTDAAGNVATAPADYSQAVDTVIPTVTSVVISATGASGSLLNAGDVVTVTATYSEAVSGQPTTAPTLTIGAETGIALTAGTTTGNTRTWTYTIANTGTTDTGSISVVGNLVAGITDAAGNAVTGSTPTATGSFTADTTAPTVVITDNAAGTATGPVTFTYTFAEAVTGFDTSKVTATGGTKGTFTAVSTTVYTLVVTPAANSTTPIELVTSTTGVIDAAGNVATAPADYSQAVDTVIPTVTSVVISATGASGSLLNAGDVVTVTATYSEAVSGQPTTAPTLTIGAETGIALTAGTTTGNTRTWTYTITNTGTTDTGSISVAGNLVAGVSDLAGNAVTGNTPAATGGFTADTVAPVATAAVTAITDNVGSLQGTVARGGMTDDTQLLVSGTLSQTLQAGDTVRVYDGSTFLGLANVVVNNVSSLSPGSNSGSGTLPNGVRALFFDTWDGNFVSHVYLPTAPNVGDLVKVRDGSSAPNSYPISVRVGNSTTFQVLSTLNGSNLTDVFQWDGARWVNVEASIDLVSGGTNTRWTYDDTRTLLDAQSVSYTAQVADAAGNQSAAGTAYTATVDTTPPAAPDLLGSTAGVQTSDSQNYTLSHAGTALAIAPLIAANADADVASMVLTVGGAGDSVNDRLVFGPVTQTLGSTAASGSNITVNGVSGVDWSYSAAKVLTLSKNGGGVFSAAQVQAIEQGLQFSASSGTAQGARSFALAHRDLAGNTGASATSTVLVDTIAPSTTAAMTGLADNWGGVQGNLASGGVTDDTTLVLSGTFGGATVGASLAVGENLRVFDGSTYLGNAAVTVVPGGQSTWTYVDVRTLGHAQALSYTVRVVDAVGNPGAASAAYTATLDTQAPAASVAVSALIDELSSSGVVPSGGTTGSANLRLSGTLGGAATGTSLAADERVRIYDGGSYLGEATVRVVPGGQSTWTYTDSRSLLNTQTLSYNARLVDLAGNQGAISTSYTATVDTSAPTASVLSLGLDADTGHSASDFITANSEPILRGTLSAPLGSNEQVYVSIDNGSTWRPVDLSAPGQSSWATGLSLAGSQTLKVKVGNRLGNSGPVLSQAYALDSTAPIVNLDQRDASLDYKAGTLTQSTAQNVVSLTGVSGQGVGLTEDGGISRIELRVSGLRDGSNERIQVAGTSTFSLAADGSSLPATLSLTDPNQAGWSLEHAHGVFTFKPLSGGTPSTTSASSAAWLLNALGYQNLASTVSDGIRQFAFTAVDSAGHASLPSTSSVTLNASRPALSGVSPVLTLDADGDGVKGEQFILSLSEAVRTTPLEQQTTQARYVLVKQDGSASARQLYLNELQVLDAAGNNLARSAGVSVSASSYTTHSGYLASEVIDGNLAREAGYASNQNTTDNWLQIDLGKVQSIAKLQMYALSSSSSDLMYSAGVSMYVSTQALSSLSTAQLRAGELGAYQLGASSQATYAQTLGLHDMLGAGASISALNPFTVDGERYASQYLVKGGAGRTYTSGSTLRLAAVDVVGTGGALSDSAAGPLVFTVPDLVAPQGVTAPLYVSSDNWVNNTEATAAGGVGTAFSFTASADNARIRYYLNGVELTGKAAALTASQTSQSLTLLPADFTALSDGRYSLTARLEDSTSTSGGTVGNLGAMSSPQVFTLDRALSQGLASARLSTDANNNGAANAGDVVTLVFNEAVNITASSLPAAFGTGATVADVGAGFGSTAFSNTWTVTLGTSPSLAGNQSVSLTTVRDMAGNTGTVTATLPTDLLSTPSVTQVANVTSDNVIGSSERASAQTITVNLSGARTGDVVRLFMDGVQVGSELTLTGTHQTSQTASFTVAANAWGSDGERILTSSIQRGSGAVQNSPQRSVAVAADGTHWAASGVFWLDPDSLAAGSTITSWAPSAGQGTASANAGSFRVIAANPGANQVVFDGSNWMSFLSSTLAGASSTSVFSTYQLNQTPGTSFPSLYHLGGWSQSSSVSSATSSIGVEFQGNARIQAGNWPTGTYMGTGTNGLIVGAATTLSQIWDFSQGTASVQLNGAPYASRSAGAASTFASTNVNGYLGIFGDRDSGGTRYRGQFGDLIVATSALGNAASQEINAYLAFKYQTAGTPVIGTGTASLSGVITPSVYDLASSASSTAFIDQTLDLRSQGGSGVRVLTAGSDGVATGAGADTIHVKDLNYRSIDAGQGHDTLVLDSSYTSAGTLVLSDFVSNARGNSADVVANARVNAAGFHKLAGIEAMDLSQSRAAQTLVLTPADVNQLSDDNILRVVLGSNDSLSAIGFASTLPTWGSYSVDGVVYDQRWSQGSGADAVTLYARGQAPGELQGFGLVAGASSGNDVLAGTPGNDILQGGLGQDSLTGGAGADVFRFKRKDLGLDTVTDFEPAQGDKLDLRWLLDGRSFSADQWGRFLKLSALPASADLLLQIDVTGSANFALSTQSVLFKNAASGGLALLDVARLLQDRVMLTDVLPAHVHSVVSSVGAGVTGQAFDFVVRFSGAPAKSLATDNFVASYADVTQVSALGGNTYKVSVQPHSGASGVNVALAWVGNGLQDANGLEMQSMDLSNLGGLQAIDTRAPTAVSQFSLVSASTPSNLTRASQPMLSGLADPGEVVQIHRVTANGNTLAGTATVSDAGTWTWSAPSALNDGSYSYVASVRDAAGNLSGNSAPLNLSIDTRVDQPTVSGASDSLVFAARYVMVKANPAVFKGGYFGGFSEVEVFSGGVNVALGKSVTVPTGTSGHYAGAAGITNGSFGRG